jgi:hypothetical protein
MSGQAERSLALRRFFRPGPWENVAMLLMLMQPVSLWLYGHSFTVILLGTIGFVIVSHFPEE